MLLIAGLLALVVVLSLLLSWSLRRSGGASRARNRRAQQGEWEAEDLLEDLPALEQGEAVRR